MDAKKCIMNAPGADRPAQNMKAFLDWYNADDKLDPIIKTALAHLWFVTIHPFDDGNGRVRLRTCRSRDRKIARNVSTACRRRSVWNETPIYDMLEATQKGDLDVTPWLEWFLACLDRAFDSAEAVLANVFNKAEFWRKYAEAPLNKRQRDILNRLLDGFEGKLTSSRYAKIENVHQTQRCVTSPTLSITKFLRKTREGPRYYSLPRFSWSS
jgi:Fic family protein